MKKPYNPAEEVVKALDEGAADLEGDTHDCKMDVDGYCEVCIDNERQEEDPPDEPDEDVEKFK